MIGFLIAALLRMNLWPLVAMGNLALGYLLLQADVSGWLIILLLVLFVERALLQLRAVIGRMVFRKTLRDNLLSVGRTSAVRGQHTFLPPSAGSEGETP